MKQRLTTFPPPELKKYSFLETYTFLYSVYTDLLLSQLWEELKIHQLPSNRSIIQGISPQNHKTFYVYPCSLEEIWNILGEDKQTLLLGIVSPDSTIVYYKINNGLIKPRKNDED
ncbi:unnamed protein product [Pneumocystis jirovecii]|uniref:tRNA-splicing endonuclease subunit Sen15 domain-containing protein n=1 Tax=Pneumocystis jirovecii TaxID=42068 RepID=L0PCP7_PNEJI|nr:unnamed protein product [Pneumocystis jirovecii]